MQSYRHPDAHWFGTPNFTSNREGHDMAIPPAYVVLHTMVGTMAGANARFQQSSEQASATYGIGLDGALYQWVDEADAAWANGTFANNPGSNLDSVSIEHEDNGDYNGPRTPQLYNASARLVGEICRRYNIPVDREHILGHRECATVSPTACPDALDVDRIVRMASTSSVPAPPRLLAGGSSDMSLAVAPRPDGSGMDVLRIAPDGSVWWQGNVPYWNLGAWGEIWTTPLARAVSVAWVGADAMVVSVLTEDGQSHINSLHPSTGWKFGDWEIDQGPWLVPAAKSDIPQPFPTTTTTTTFAAHTHMTDGGTPKAT